MVCREPESIKTNYLGLASSFPTQQHVSHALRVDFITLCRHGLIGAARVVALSRDHQFPRDAGNFVGDGHGNQLGRLPLHHIQEPGARMLATSGANMP